MNIRAKLTLTFFMIVIVVLSAISVAIYYFSSNYRELDFYRRLKNRASNTAQVLIEVTEVDAELLRRMERNNPASLPNQYIVIFDSTHHELYSSEGGNIIPPDPSLLTRIRSEGELRFNYRNYEVLGFVFSENAHHLTVLAAATDVYGLDALRNLRNVLVTTFSVSVVLVSILGWFYSGKVLSPIAKIVNEVSKISEANLSQRVPEGNNRDELSQLARTFNAMLGRLQAAFASQKNFIANASHEIKTPITIMSAEIEVTLLKERPNDYYIAVLKSVLGGLKGLNSLSTQLLLLAQTSADLPSKHFSQIRIDDILWEIKEELTKAHPNYSIDILLDLHLNHESLVIDGDEQLVKIAILNLMDNGCKYSDDNHVTINVKSINTHQVALEFTNSGPGIEPEYTEKIFAPFFRGNNNKTVKGFGIGLSLVSRIVKLHEGSIGVESHPGKYTQFTVAFPVRK